MAQTGDGRLLAVPCWNDIVLFEARTGTLLRTLTGHIREAYRPAFSPDGKRLASGSIDPILRVWDVATGREELGLTDHKCPVWSVAFDPEGKRLVSADEGGTVKVRDGQGRVVTTLPGHTKGVNQLAFSPDGKRLATASLDGTCKVWDTDTWQEIRSLPANNGKTFAAVAWSRDGKLLAAGDDAEVILWNADSYQVLHTLKTPGKGMVAFTPDGRTLLTARTAPRKGERHAFTRWDVKTGIQQKTCELPTSGSYVFFHLSPDGRTVLVSYDRPAEARVRAYDAETGQERFPPRGHLSSVIAVAVSPDGRTLASGGADATVRLWDLAAWRSGQPSPPVRVLEGHTNEVWSVAFSPDGKLLASGGTDGLILLWDVAPLTLPSPPTVGGEGRVRGRKVRELTGHFPRYAYLTFSPDGRTLVAGGKDGAVHRWDAAHGPAERAVELARRPGAAGGLQPRREASGVRRNGRHRPVAGRGHRPAPARLPGQHVLHEPGLQPRRADAGRRHRSPERDPSPLGPGNEGGTGLDRPHPPHPGAVVSPGREAGGHRRAGRDRAACGASPRKARRCGPSTSAPPEGPIARPSPRKAVTWPRAWAMARSRSCASRPCRPNTYPPRRRSSPHPPTWRSSPPPPTP